VLSYTGVKGKIPSTISPTKYAKYSVSKFIANREQHGGHNLWKLENSEGVSIGEREDRGESSLAQNEDLFSFPTVICLIHLTTFLSFGQRYEIYSSV